MLRFYTQTNSECNTPTNNLLQHCGAMGLSENLRRMMEAQGENPHSLAAKAGVPQSTIYRILTGDSKDPRRSTVAKLAKYFCVHIDDLYAASFVSKADQERAAYKVGERAFPDMTHEERTLLQGFRKADKKDREQMLWLARRSLTLPRR